MLVNWEKVCVSVCMQNAISYLKLVLVFGIRLVDCSLHFYLAYTFILPLIKFHADKIQKTKIVWSSPVFSLIRYRGNGKTGLDQTIDFTVVYALSTLNCSVTQ